MQIVSRLYPRIGPRRLTIVGLLWVLVTMVLMLFMGKDTSLWVMRVLLFLMGTGMAYMFLPMQTAAFATIKQSEMGRASAAFNVQWQLGIALGIAVMSTVLSTVGLTRPGTNGAPIPNLNAYHVAFMAATVLVVIGITIAFNVRDKDAAATMRREIEPGTDVEAMSEVALPML
jgi:MFS family permease